MNFNAMEMIRRQPDMFLDPSIDRLQAVAMRLVATALHEGQRKVTVEIFDTYFQVGTESNWIAPEYKDEVAYKIDRLLPLSGIPNSVRGEILLPALADWFSIVDGREALFESTNAPSIKTYLPTLVAPFTVVVGIREK